MSNFDGNPGRPASLVIGRNSDNPNGGRAVPQPEFIHRRVLVPTGALTLTTVWRNGSVVYRVTQLDSRNRPAAMAEEFPTLRRARNAANRLYRSLTEEN